MKLSARILILSLCLCLVFGTLLAGTLQQGAFRADLSGELTRGLDASGLFAASLSASISALSQLNDPDSRARAIRITTQYMAELALAAVTDHSGRILHDNFGPHSAALLDRMPTQPAQYLIVKDTQGAAWQLVRRAFEAEGERYNLYYAWPLERVYQRARLQARQAAALLGALSLALALALYLSLRLSFQPLERLSAVAGAIAAGKLSARAQEGRRHDEVGQLSRAFNHMAQATQLHIDQLTKRDTAQKQFIADMAHELKTPLTSIIGYADLMRRSPLTDLQRQKALEAITLQGERLSRMGMKLLHLARLDGDQQPELLPHDAVKLMAEAADSLDAAFSQAGVQLLRSGSGSLLCDRDLTLTLLQNLLSNALKASQPGARVWLQFVDNAFTVKDEGCGIPAEHLEHVTEAFYMVEKSRARSQQGAGLGLALCQRIAALQGALLTIQSTEHEGTCVCVAFTNP